MLFNASKRSKCPRDLHDNRPAERPRIVPAHGRPELARAGGNDGTRTAHRRALRARAGTAIDQGRPDVRAEADKGRRVEQTSRGVAEGESQPDPRGDADRGLAAAAGGRGTVRANANQAEFGRTGFQPRASPAV